MDVLSYARQEKIQGGESSVDAIKRGIETKCNIKITVLTDEEAGALEKLQKGGTVLSPEQTASLLVHKAKLISHAEDVKMAVKNAIRSEKRRQKKKRKRQARKAKVAKKGGKPKRGKETSSNSEVDSDAETESESESSDSSSTDSKKDVSGGTKPTV